MKVAIICKYVPEYRAAFFNLLRERAASAGITVDLFAGEPEARDVPRGDAVELPWAHRVSNCEIRLGSAGALYQPVLRATRGYDFVVVEQAARLLFNYAAMALSRMGGPRVIAWGHGRDLGSGAREVTECLKRHTLDWPDFWFAYSEGTRRYLEAAGVHSGRISVVHNSKQVECGDSVGESGDAQMVFVGSLESHKHLQYVLDVADLVRSRVVDARMLFVGSGSEAKLVDRFCAARHWATHMPATHGKALGAIISSSAVMLNPYGAGLTIVDAIQCGLPMVLVDGGGHGPEYEYVVPGVNAVVCRYGVTTHEFADTVTEVLTNDSHRDKLVEGCQASAPFCSLERMVDDFISGLRSAQNA